MTEQVIRQVPIGDVKPYPNNPRMNDDAVAKVASSIAAFGFRQPIVVDEKMVILAGHTRLRAAESLKLVTVPVIVVTDLTPEQARAYRIADNRTAEEATWDRELLALEMKDLQTADETLPALLGFDAGEVDEIFKEAPPEFQPDLAPGFAPIDPVTPGDVAKAGEKLAGQYEGEPRPLEGVICPNCAHRFYVDDLNT